RAEASTSTRCAPGPPTASCSSATLVQPTRARSPRTVGRRRALDPHRAEPGDQAPARRAPCQGRESAALVLLPGHLLHLGAIVLAVTGEAVEPLVVVADLGLRLGRHVGVADRHRVDVVVEALRRRTVPGSEADLTKRLHGTVHVRHPADGDVDDAAAVVGPGGVAVARVVRALGERQVLAGFPLGLLQHGLGALVARLAVHARLAAGADGAGQLVAPVAELGQRALAGQPRRVETAVTERTLVLGVRVDGAGAEVAVDVLLRQQVLRG